MPDEVTQEAQSQAQGAVTPAVADGPKYVTADDLKAFRDGLFADTRKMLEGHLKPFKGKAREATEQSESPTSQPNVQELIAREREISEAFADHPHLSGAARKNIRDLADLRKPEDLNGFIAEQARLFAPAAGKSATTTNPPAANARPVSDVGAPVAPPKVTDDVPVWRWSDQDRARYVAEKGHQAFRNLVRKQIAGVKIRTR